MNKYTSDSIKNQAQSTTEILTLEEREDIKIDIDTHKDIYNQRARILGFIKPLRYIGMGASILYFGYHFWSYANSAMPIPDALKAIESIRLILTSAGVVALGGILWNVEQLAIFLEDLIKAEKDNSKKLLSIGAYSLMMFIIGLVLYMGVKFSIDMDKKIKIENVELTPHIARMNQAFTNRQNTINANLMTMKTIDEQINNAKTSGHINVKESKKIEDAISIVKTEIDEECRNRFTRMYEIWDGEKKRPSTSKFLISERYAKREIRKIKNRRAGEIRNLEEKLVALKKGNTAKYIESLKKEKIALAMNNEKLSSLQDDLSTKINNESTNNNIEVAHDADKESAVALMVSTLYVAVNAMIGFFRSFISDINKETDRKIKKLSAKLRGEKEGRKRRGSRKRDEEIFGEEIEISEDDKELYERIKSVAVLHDEWAECNDGKRRLIRPPFAICRENGIMIQASRFKDINTKFASEFIRVKNSSNKYGYLSIFDPEQEAHNAMEERSEKEDFEKNGIALAEMD